MLRPNQPSPPAQRNLTPNPSPWRLTLGGRDSLGEGRKPDWDGLCRATISAACGPLSLAYAICVANQNCVCDLRGNPCASCANLRTPMASGRAHGGSRTELRDKSPWFHRSWDESAEGERVVDRADARARASVPSSCTARGSKVARAPVKTGRGTTNHAPAQPFPPIRVRPVPHPFPRTPPAHATMNGAARPNSPAESASGAPLVRKSVRLPDGSFLQCLSESFDSVQLSGCPVSPEVPMRAGPLPIATLRSRGAVLPSPSNARPFRCARLGEGWG